MRTQDATVGRRSVGATATTRLRRRVDGGQAVSDGNGVVDLCSTDRGESRWTPGSVASGAGKHDGVVQCSRPSRRARRRIRCQPCVDGELDAGSWFSPTVAGERVPRLSEVLDLIDVEFELELKGYGHDYLAAVIDEVVERDVLGRVEFTSSNVPLLTILKAELPTARVGFFSQPQHPSLTNEAFAHHIVGVARTAPFDVAHVHAANVTASIVGRLHELGLTVHANDARDGTDVQRAIDAGADRLSTDDIETAVATVDRQSS